MKAINVKEWVAKPNAGLLENFSWIDLSEQKHEMGSKRNMRSLTELNNKNGKIFKLRKNGATSLFF